MSPRMMYLAGASEEVERVKRFAQEAKTLGWSVTHPWWLRVEEILAAGVPETSMTSEARGERADEDFRGVHESKLFLLLVPSPESVTKNSWTELGIALGLRHVLDSPRIWVVGEPCATRFFSLRADRHFDTEGECLAALAIGE